MDDGTGFWIRVVNIGAFEIKQKWEIKKERNQKEKKNFHVFIYNCNIFRADHFADGSLVHLYVF